MLQAFKPSPLKGPESKEHQLYDSIFKSTNSMNPFSEGASHLLDSFREEEVKEEEGRGNKG